MDQQRDASAGYDAIAERYMANRSTIGADLVRSWAETLPKPATLLDIGCGHGEPLTAPLLEAGLSVYAIDASAHMVAAYKARWPSVMIACETVEDSRFFDRRFNAALMVGLIFLIEEPRQKAVIKRLSNALLPGGHLLFSAPHQAGSWRDVMTQNMSWSLGEKAYRRLLKQAGFTMIATHLDEGGNHYYEAVLGL